MVVAQVSSSADSLLAARRLAALKSGGNNGYPNLIPERVIDDGAEDDVRLLMRRSLDEIRSG